MPHQIGYVHYGTTKVDTHFQRRNQMIQEYLVQDASVKSIFEQLDLQEFENKAKDTTIKRKTQVLKEGEFWIISFETIYNNEATAKALDSLSSVLESHKGITILSKGSSEYYNKKLYPLINDFERLLRKLLYMVAAINKTDNASKSIQNLEALTFFDLYVLLFVDNNYAKQAKDTINQKDGKFTKKEIIELISNMQESTVWDSLIGNDLSPTLYNNLENLREYRNSVMHAHNINSDTYHEAKELYEKVNEELQELIKNNEPFSASASEYLYESVQSSIESTSRAVQEIFKNSLEETAKSMVDMLLSSLKSKYGSR